MKKLFVLAITMLVVFSCADEIEFNNPAMQGKRDGGNWKARVHSGFFNEHGKAVISGSNGYDVINLELPSFSVGTYLLGESNTNEAILVDYNGQEYSTNNLPDREAELYPPDGIIEITDFSPERNTITGKFWFNAYSVSGSKTVNFSQGVFYEIPIPTSSGPVLMSCNDAVANTSVAETAYNATIPTDSGYQAICAAYKSALVDQQIACGDGAGTLQSLIDGLICD
ncbi:MAG: DUF6252 family protein [Xanthomarina sp.]